MCLSFLFVQLFRKTHLTFSPLLAPLLVHGWKNCGGAFSSKKPLLLSRLSEATQPRFAAVSISFASSAVMATLCGPVVRAEYLHPRAYGDPTNRRTGKKEGGIDYDITGKLHR